MSGFLEFYQATNYCIPEKPPEEHRLVTIIVGADSDDAVESSERTTIWATTKSLVHPGVGTAYLRGKAAYPLFTKKFVDGLLAELVSK